MLCTSYSNNDTEKAGHSSKDSGTVITKKEKNLVIDGAYELTGDSVKILPFEIDLNLNPKAVKKITTDKETIIVSVSYEGTPKMNSNASLKEDGSFFVASAEKVITYGQAVKFDAFKFSKEIYAQLEDKNVDMTVNVYSGRLDQNPFNAKAVSFSFSNNKRLFTIEKEGKPDIKIKGGINHWVREGNLKPLPYSLYSLRRIDFDSIVTASTTWQSHYNLLITWRFIETVLGDRLTFLFDEDKLTIKFLYSAARLHNKADNRTDITGRLVP